MSDVRPRLPTGWVRFDSHGREFWKTAIHESGRPGGFFSVAQPVAGRYRVEELHAVGESSVVLWAFDLSTSKSVAIKALRADLWLTRPDEPDAAARLIAEIRRARHLLQTERRLLVRLRNAGCNGVPCPHDYVYDRNAALDEAPIDDFLTANEPYLVLGRLSGRTLEELIVNEYPSGMSEPMAVSLILPIVRTLEILHAPWRLANGRTWHCVYQDLKPANIVIDGSGQSSLLDFGGCQVVVDGVPVLEGSHTPGYSPPECGGPAARVLLPCADVYGIGSTLYHMLTGIDPRARLARWRGGPGGHLDGRSLPRHCTPGLRCLIERCLAPRPSDRPSDARQVAQTLNALFPT